MPALSPKENLLRLIHRSNPEYIPYGLESTIEVFHQDALFYKGNGDPRAKKWTDVWGVGFEKSDPTIPEIDGYSVFHPLKDWDHLDEFSWPDPNREGIMDNAIAIKVDRATTLVLANNPASMFVRSWLLTGLDSFLSALILEPEKAGYIMDKVMSYQERIAERYVELGIDIAQLGDDIGTTKALMVNPALWRRVVKPRLKRVIDVYKNTGCLVLFHSCGCLTEIIDDIIDLGVDILNPVQAGANDLAFIRMKTKGKLTLYGGIDAHIVATSNPEEVSELAKKVLNLLGREGEYIASSDHIIYYPFLQRI